MQIDLTYLNKKMDVEELQNNYLLNFTNHFSKFSIGFFISNKTSEEFIKYLKYFLSNV